MTEHTSEVGIAKHEAECQLPQRVCHPRARGGFGMGLFLWVCSGLLAASAGTAVEKKTLSFNYRFEAPRMETNGEYTRLMVAECDLLHRIGEPAMPFRTARLLIPSGYTVENVEAVTSTQPVELEGTWRVEYAGQPHSRPGSERTAFTVGLNHFVYDFDALYPPSTAELISVQQMAGYDIALVRVFPVQYKASSGRLLFADRMSVRLSLAPASTKAEPPLHPPMLGQAIARVAAFVNNPELLQSPEQHRAGDSAATGPCFDYLLMTSSNLVSAFQPLLERKIQDGLAVKVETVETITNTFSGRDVPEQIRNYIRYAYTNWGISYVLLGGGTTIIPCRHAYVHVDVAPKDSYVPCDLYYACLDGSWNANGDKHWGEATDGENGGDVDLLAEVYVGRAPVATVTQVNTFVEKTLRYEAGGNANYTNALLMATFLGEFPTGPCQGADMYVPLLPLLGQYQVSLLDDRPHKLPQWSRTETLAALNRSPHVVFYNGHGNADVLLRMRTPDLMRLTNQWPFLACSVGCSAGEFDHGKFWPDSFGETLINGSSHGAFAAILNARAGWFDLQYPWKYSGEFQVKLFEEFLRRRHANLGVASQNSKEQLVGQVEASGAMTYRWCYYGITLLGDPHVEFKLPAPQSALGAPVPEVHATDAGEGRVESVNEQLRPARDSAGQAKLPANS
jgi:hypothetical protein